MDKTEIHYLTYDPEEIFKEMQYAFIEAGGDVLYPGDEKEMLLRGVQSVLTQAFAGVDNALRMATLRYAQGNYLDIYGEKRNCERIRAAAARATAEITFRATGIAKTIEAGSTLTADGEHIYALDDDVAQSGHAQVIRVGITARDTGSAGNGLLAGTQMQFMVPQTAVQSVYCVEDAKGGQEKENDETYRARIRKFGLANTTTGPRMQYESVAMNVTSEVLDAHAANLGAGKVGVSLLLRSEKGADAIMKSVKDALNATSVRPMTDEVIIQKAKAIPYKLNVQYRAESGSDITAALGKVISDYQAWQDESIGRAFNPDRLMAELYQAGATRVIWGEGSQFNGASNMEYTEIEADAHCKGTITLSMIS